MSYWNYLLPAITFGFAAGVQPGPLSVYLISQTLQSGWKRTFPAIFTPLVTDGPVAVFCLLILGNLPAGFLNYIQFAGGFFLLYLALKAAKSWKKKENARVTGHSARKTLLDAMFINILNPNAYLGWSLVIGPMFLKAWKAGPAIGISLLAGFYLTMFVFTALLLFLFHKSRERVPKLQQAFICLSAMFLALFGIYQLFAGGMGIFIR